MFPEDSPLARVLYCPEVTMRTTLAATALVASFALAQGPAHACGGTFCSNSPINQNAERVLFIKHGGGETTAVVQIQAQGNDPDFAWVVPLDALPHDIHEEDSTAFVAVDLVTAPQYVFQNFTAVAQRGGFGCGGSAESAALAAPNESGAAVHTWASGETGNYRYDVVSSNDPMALRDWLDQNHYRTPAEAVPIIGEYVSEHKFFLAVRLRSVQGVPSFLVSPLAFTYAGRSPCVPIRLTRIATTPTLPILAYVISDQRAVPANYANTEVNDRAVAELGPGRFNITAYDTLVTQAIRDAGGRAWITEFAGELPESARSAMSPQLQALLPARPYLTRLYTTLSSDRMDTDPEFNFTRELRDVSNVHDLRSLAPQRATIDLRWLLGVSTLVGLARLGARRFRRNG